MAILPPGVSAKDFARATDEFAAAVGRDWVLTSEDDLLPYRDSFSTLWDRPGERRAAAAVSPTTVSQVQAIVRTANRYRVPLFPISTGKNFGYGGPAPNVTGSVVVDLKRMDRVLEVDDKRNFALVEPGVSYFDLYRHIQERKLKVMLDVPDPGWGSPVGNSLDRGIGYTMSFYRDHIGASAGMEVVLANGEVMRTGMGALPGAETWQEYRHGFGPDPAGLFAQGNFGIVTKMGFRLMPLPEHYLCGMITVPRRQDLIALVEHANYLSDSMLCGEVVYGSPLASLTGDKAFRDLITKAGGASFAEMDKAAADASLPAWSIELQFYGPEATCRANWAYAKDRILAAIPGAKALEGEGFGLPPTEAQLRNDTMPYKSAIKRHATLGIPNLGMWKIVRESGHLGFFPVFPRSGEAVFEIQRVLGDVNRRYPQLNSYFTAITAPFAYYQAFQMVFAPLVKRDDQAYNRMAHEAMVAITEEAARHGWGDYRAPPIYQDLVSSTYSFGDHALRRFHETIKDAADPNGILAPGRGGVWPKRFRRA